MTQELKLGLTEKPSGKQVFGYVIGTVPLVILIGIFSMSYAKFFWDTENGLPFWLYAIGLGIYALVNSINDPFIGQWQDKTNVDKWGSRRLVYVKYGSPILVLLFIFMWFPITMDNTLYLFLHFVIMICAFDTVLNIVTMAWMALLPSMTADIDERTKINFLGSIIGLFAGFPVIAMPLILVE
ncbi:MAG: hypothetical protein GY870_11485, partial [archaeon]|nr:hypothetical protein [archaeon]